MCQYKVHVTDAGEVDAELLGWIRPPTTNPRKRQVRYHSRRAMRPLSPTPQPTRPDGAKLNTSNPMPSTGRGQLRPSSTE